MVGLGDTAGKEARKRVESALTDGDYTFPQMKVVINLAPGNIKKSGSHFDLPMALGLLMETNQLKGEKVHQSGSLGANDIVLPGRTIGERIGCWNCRVSQMQRIWEAGNGGSCTLSGSERHCRRQWDGQRH